MPTTRITSDDRLKFDKNTLEKYEILLTNHYFRYSAGLQ